jgi:[acyl-carrier-protein] S-malonyltransferase
MVFPGVGPSAFSDVARFMVANSAARTLVAEADAALGYSLIDRYQDDKSEYSEFSRVAFLVNCLALAQWSDQEFGIQPDVCTGASFGGTPAAVYAGALPFKNAVQLTARWGHHLDEYFTREYRDVVTQSLARIPGDRLAEILRELAESGEWHDIACYVDHDFYMVSVREERLEWLKKQVQTAGGLPLYTMRPPMHSHYFGPLRDRIESELFRDLPFTDPQLPIVSDHDGTVVETAAGVHDLLLDAIVRPVRWPEVLTTLKGLGVGRLHVSGQDSLWGRVNCATSTFEVVPIKPELALRPRRRTIPGHIPAGPVRLPHLNDGGPEHSRGGKVLHIERVACKHDAVSPLKFREQLHDPHGIQAEVAQAQILVQGSIGGKEGQMLTQHTFKFLIPHSSRQPLGHGGGNPY